MTTAAGLGEPFDSALNKAMESGVDNGGNTQEEASTAETPLEQQLVSLYIEASRLGIQYAQTTHQKRQRDAYSAFNNQHVTDSKYRTNRFKARSKLVRPLTRAAVRRRMVSAAASLFSTRDVINVTAENPADQMQEASAAVLHEIMNYRLSRPSFEGGLSWFTTCMGAIQDGSITGIIASKQYWEFKVVDDGVEEQATYNSVTGQNEIAQVPRTRVVKDKPCCILYPSENVIRDPGADWLDQGQSGSYLILRNPMAVHEVKTMLASDVDRETGEKLWLPLSQTQIMQAVDNRLELAALRQSRDGNNTDRMTDTAAGGVGSSFSIVWLDEVFMWHEGVQYCYWMLGRNICKAPKPVHAVYPHMAGARPVVIGLTEIEAHKTSPTSPVESWMPLQFEANDLTNLALDGIKNTMNPVAMVKKGAGVSLEQVQNRSSDAVIMVKNHDDVWYDRPGDISGTSFHQMDRINADFDALAGQFNTSSVQTNRQLNDTVGGMKLMNASAASVGDYDQLVVVNTWVEPTLHQILRLEQYYERDENIIGLAGDKAKVWEKYRIPYIDDKFMEQPMSFSVDVGMGATDPIQRMNRFASAWSVTQTILSPERVTSEVKRDMVIDEVFALAGYKQGSRFFNKTAEEDPRITQLSQQIGELEAQLASKDKEMETKLETVRLGIAGTLLQNEVRTAAAEKSAEKANERSVGTKVVDHVLRRGEQKKPQGKQQHQRMGGR
jgi:hypothetical protein